MSLSRKSVLNLNKEHEGGYTTVTWWATENFSKLKISLNDIIAKVVGRDDYHSFNNYDFIDGKDKRNLIVNWNGDSEIWLYDKAKRYLETNGTTLRDYLKSKVKELAEKC